jgi:ribonuclease P protein component
LSTPSYHFPSCLRLKAANEFNYVFSRPAKTSAKYLGIYYRKSQLGYPRLGLVVAKKHIKKAIDRNRIKRLIRESFRLNRHVLPVCDYVVVIYQGIADLTNKEIREQLNKQWQKLPNRIQEV